MGVVQLDDHAIERIRERAEQRELHCLREVLRQDAQRVVPPGRGF